MNFPVSLIKSIRLMLLNQSLLLHKTAELILSESKFKNLDLIKIYLIPPNKNELKKRLINRNQDSLNEVERRFKSFDEDIQHWHDYDYVLINEILENCYKQIETIISIHKNKKTKFFQNIQ